MTLLTINIEKIGLKDAGQCIDPYITVSVKGNDFCSASSVLLWRECIFWKLYWFFQPARKNVCWYFYCGFRASALITGRKKICIWELLGGESLQGTLLSVHSGVPCPCWELSDFALLLHHDFCSWLLSTDLLGLCVLPTHTGLQAFWRWGTTAHWLHSCPLIKLIL